MVYFLSMIPGPASSRRVVQLPVAEMRQQHDFGARVTLPAMANPARRLQFLAQPAGTEARQSFVRIPAAAAIQSPREML